MAVSPVDIANLALTRLGQDTIVSLTDESSRARAVNAVYSISRDAVLRGHPWNFAQKRVKLTADSAAPTFGYTKQFELPADFLRVTRLNEQSRDFRVEGNKILCNASTINVVYTYRVTDSNLFDNLFVDTLAYRIAADTARQLTGSIETHNLMVQLYERSLTEAKFLDSSEKPDLNLNPAYLLESRLADSPYRAIEDTNS